MSPFRLAEAFLEEPVLGACALTSRAYWPTFSSSTSSRGLFQVTAIAEYNDLF